MYLRKNNKKVKKVAVTLLVVISLTLLYTLPALYDMGAEYKTLKAENNILSVENKEIKGLYQTSLSELLGDKAELVKVKAEYRAELDRSLARLDKEQEESERLVKLLQKFSTFLDENNDQLQGQIELLERLSE